MSQGIIIYFFVAVLTHFSLVLGMAILLPVGHSLYCFIRKKTDKHTTATLFRQQLKYLLIIIAISMLTGSLQLMVPPHAADVVYRLSLVIDIVGPLLVFAQTMRRLKAAESGTT